ncbi:MAG: hypothetical protein JWO67_6242 [Streptosporangiaceae bacterium]|nr:hypothetical protein [Streptosporangiaceae bacterium]
MTAIGRGPMAADNFTQIHNGVFRDPRLSAKAMGIFAHVSTHREGWQTNVEMIAKGMQDGEAAIKGALKELEHCGYLVRGQQRGERGRRGDGWMFITDLPAQYRALGMDEEAADEAVLAALELWIAARLQRDPGARHDVSPGSLRRVPRADLARRINGCEAAASSQVSAASR